MSLKDLPSLRAVVAGGKLASFRGVDALFERVDRFVAAHGLAPSSSCFGLFPTPRQRLAPDGPVDVLAGTPVGAWAKGNATVGVRESRPRRCVSELPVGMDA